MKPTTYYTVKVIGILWSGCPAAYSKNFTTKPDSNHQVKREFGDFDTLTDYQVEEVSFSYISAGKKFTTVKTQEIVKDWDSEENEFIYLDCVD